MFNWISGFIFGIIVGVCITMVCIYSHFLDNNLRDIIERIMQYQ